jgi:hypothetical protein
MLHFLLLRSGQYRNYHCNEYGNAGQNALYPQRRRRRTQYAAIVQHKMAMASFPPTAEKKI